MMKLDHISLEIEGNYLISYIYSGVLVLVDFEFNLIAYSWKDVVDRLLSNTPSLLKYIVSNYLNNSTNKKLNSSFKKNILSISKSSLLECHHISINIGVWPSDLTIYKNRIYYSSEKGVSIIDFKWANGRIESFSNPKKIWAEPSFTISVNTFYRLAISAGKSGLLGYIPDNSTVNEKFIKQLFDSICTDCDWQDESLIANTINGVKLLEFDVLPTESEFNGDKKEYWPLINKLKRNDPIINDISNTNNTNIINAWQAGNKLFFLSHDMRVGYIDKNDFSTQNYKFHFSNSRFNDVIASKTASFGTVIESNDSLKTIIKNDIETIDSDFSTWKVFPRSKSYANQIHIIKDAHLKILTIDSSDAHGFGFDIDTNSWL